MSTEGNGNGFLQSWGLTEEKRNQWAQRDLAPGLAVLRVPSQSSEVFELLPHLQMRMIPIACSPGFWAARMEQELLHAVHGAEQGWLGRCESL